MKHYLKWNITFQFSFAYFSWILWPIPLSNAIGKYSSQFLGTYKVEQLRLHPDVFKDKEISVLYKQGQVPVAALKDFSETHANAHSSTADIQMWLFSLGDEWYAGLLIALEILKRLHHAWNINSFFAEIIVAKYFLVLLYIRAEGCGVRRKWQRGKQRRGPRVIKTLLSIPLLRHPFISLRLSCSLSLLLLSVINLNGWWIHAKRFVCLKNPIFEALRLASNYSSATGERFTEDFRTLTFLQMHG